MWNWTKSVIFFTFFSTYWNVINIQPEKFSQTFRKLSILSIFMFCLVNWTYALCEIEQKVRFLFFSSTFWNLIHFWPHRFSVNFRKLTILSIFIFCLVNWTYVLRKIEQKVWFFTFSTTFWNLIHFRPGKFSQDFHKKLFILSIFIF